MMKHCPDTSFQTRMDQRSSDDLFMVIMAMDKRLEMLPHPFRIIIPASLAAVDGQVVVKHHLLLVEMVQEEEERCRWWRRKWMDGVVGNEHHDCQSSSLLLLVPGNETIHNLHLPWERLVKDHDHFPPPSLVDQVTIHNYHDY